MATKESCRQVVLELLKLKHPENTEDAATMSTSSSAAEVKTAAEEEELMIDGGGVLADGAVQITGLSAAESKARVDAEGELDRVCYINVPDEFVKTVQSRLMSTRQQCFVIDAPTSRPSAYTEYLQLTLAGIFSLDTDCSLISTLSGCEIKFSTKGM